MRLARSGQASRPISRAGARRSAVPRGLHPRALVESVGEGVEVLARLGRRCAQHVANRRDSTRIKVADYCRGPAGDLLGTAFHPEVTEISRFHAYFLGLVRSARQRSDGRVRDGGGLIASGRRYPRGWRFWRFCRSSRSRGESEGRWC